MSNDTETVTPKAIGWHRHRWTAWGKPFGAEGGFVAAFSGSAPPWWQQRTCIVCERAQRARVDIEAMP